MAAAIGELRQTAANVIIGQCKMGLGEALTRLVGPEFSGFGIADCEVELSRHEQL
jgi:hypothetical protein